MGDRFSLPERWPDAATERLAELVCDSFGAGFVSITARLGQFEPEVIPYAQLPEKSKELFREIVDKLIHRRDEWRQ